MDALQIANSLELNTSLKSHNWKVVECSGISGCNVKESFDWLVNEIEDCLFYLNR